jgi:GLPGLI family protein
MKTQIMERMKKMFEKTFVLNFDKSSSVYKEEEKLDAQGQGVIGRMMANFMGGGGTCFKKRKKKSNIPLTKKFFGKSFIKILCNLKWVLTDETKKNWNFTHTTKPQQ